MSETQLLWLVFTTAFSLVFGVSIFFIKRLVEKTEKTIEEVIRLSAKLDEIVKIEKRVVAIEATSSNLTNIVASEFAKIHESLKWLERKR